MRTASAGSAARIILALLVLTVVLPQPACQSGQTGGQTPDPLVVALELVVSGLTEPLDLQHAGDSSGRLFIVEKRGTIRIFRNGAVPTSFFLDIRDRVVSAGEQGLLGLAFHPNFRQNRRFFVNYTRNQGGQVQSVIAEYLASATNPDQADPTETIVLTVNQPGFSNHKGGQLAFGSDGILYIALGDGGGAGDPQGNAQNVNVLLGKLLRIDVDSTRPYVAPPDNPFAGRAGADEIWVYGLRNPWRFSFDRQTGRGFIADVGQNDYEEIDLMARGANYGWNIMEGAHCYPPPATGCNMAGLTLPIAEYARPEGQSVTGGYVYRGVQIPALEGYYVFGDFISGRIWALREVSGRWERTQLLATQLSISSFGMDQQGELYVVDFAGQVFRLRRGN